MSYSKTNVSTLQVNTTLKRYLPVYLYGAILIFVGIFILLPTSNNFYTIKNVAGITLIIGSFFGFITMLTRQKKEVSFLYHEMHALALLVYGASILIFCDTLESLIYFTSFVFFFYAFSEIIFCSWLFNLRKKIIYNIVFARLLIGLSVGIVVIVFVYHPLFEAVNNLANFGFLFILIGVNILLYLPIIKRKELKETFE